MKRRHFSSAALCLLLAIALLPARYALAADPVAAPVRILQITPHSITVDGPMTFNFDPNKAQCFTPSGNRMTCDTLVGVGYADKARLTIVGDIVVRIDIIDLQQ